MECARTLRVAPPSYELPTDTMRKLSELQGDDPLILTLADSA